MTRAESVEISRIWGRGLAAKELRRLDISCAAYQRLQEEYEKHHMHLAWSHKRHMWYVWRAMNAGVWKCNILTHYAGKLEVFLDVEKMLAEFRKRQPGYQQLALF